MTQELRARMICVQPNAISIVAHPLAAKPALSAIASFGQLRQATWTRRSGRGASVFAREGATRTVLGN
jgi:hypothetical protein